MRISKFDIRTSMGNISPMTPLPFLSDEELINMNKIGYTGKLDGERTTYQEYLNSLDKGEFQVSQTKFDNGNFGEAYTIIRVQENEAQEPLVMGHTDRGWALGEFTDYYGSKCSIQKSSIATQDLIWLGVDDASPQIMASDAAKYGIETEETTGWVPYPIPDEVLLSTRMHLTIEDVKALLPLLQKFVETGDLT